MSKPTRTKSLRFRTRVVGLRSVKASDLKRHPRNWRRHPPFQRKALDEILTRIGFAGALIARVDDEGDLVLIDGHLRREVAGDELIPVVVVDVDEAEADLLISTWDPLGALATADPEALADLIARQKDASEVLRRLMARTLAEAGPVIRQRDPDDAPALPRTPSTRPGDLLVLGSHRVLCADARSSEAIDSLMEGELARMMIADPPYGVSYAGKTPRALRIAGDEASETRDLLDRGFAAIAPALAPGAALYIFHPAGPAQVIFLQAFLAGGWELRQSLVWLKDSIVLGHADFHYRHEPVLYGNTPCSHRFGRGASGWYGGHAESSVIEVPRPKASRLHPTAKPVELLRRFVANSSAPGDVVLDPFLGSGSSLVAAELLGRRCFGIEIDPAYVDVAVSRWEAFTGGRATRTRSTRAD